MGGEYKEGGSGGQIGVIEAWGKDVSI